MLLGGRKSSPPPAAKVPRYRLLARWRGTELCRKTLGNTAGDPLSLLLLLVVIELDSTIYHLRLVFRLSSHEGCIANRLIESPRNAHSGAGSFQPLSAGKVPKSTAKSRHRLPPPGEA